MQAGAVHMRAADGVTREILRRLFGDRPRGFTVRLWDGTVWPDGQGEVEFVLSLTHPGALRRMLGFPLDLAIGESFVRGDFEVESQAALGTRLIAEARPASTVPHRGERLP